MGYYFYVDNGKNERKVKKKTKKQATESRKRYYRKGLGVSKVKYTWR